MDYSKSIIPNMKDFEVWFVTGSQHLYGPETLNEVAKNSAEIAKFLDGKLPVRVVCKPTVKTPDEITAVCMEANNAPKCVGLITWMHTFSPAKMWIAGLTRLSKPFAHLHTQYRRDIPWGSIDMDYMNTNQSAHGDREFGFIGTRLRLNRTVVVGHWQEAGVSEELSIWARAAVAWEDMRTMKMARFGDNMREVAVTEGDKVEAQIQLGFACNTFAVGDLVEMINGATDKEVEAMLAAYDAEYVLDANIKAGGKDRANLKETARIEVGMRKFLYEGGFRAFSNTFQDLHGMKQLPGIPTQRLMADGFGYAGEGDWKTSALVHAMKVMASGLPGGTSFMEDYTYHFDPADSKVLGAHMLEVCPSIAKSKPRLAMMPLGIGGKEDPARLIFDVAPGAGLNASLVHMGDRFRLIVNPCDVVSGEPMPKLPVASTMWKAHPDMRTAAAAWIYAGGAHHTAFSKALDERYLRAFADMAGLEYVSIDKSTTDLYRFRQELRWNDAAYLLSRMKL